MSKAKQGYTRRRMTAMIGLASAGAIVGTRPALAELLSGLSQSGLANSGELDSIIHLVARQLPHAWRLWQETSETFGQTIETTRALAAGTDIDAIMHHRTDRPFVAFDVASRRICMMAFMATGRKAGNDMERKIVGHARACDAEMLKAPTFRALEKLKWHSGELERKGLYASDYGRLWMKRSKLEYELLCEFEAVHGMELAA